MFERSTIALVCTLSLVAAAEKPLEVRLPATELGGTSYQRAQVVAALYAFSSSRVAPPGKALPEPARPIVLLWEDGRVLWSEDALRGGPPYRSGFVTQARVSAVVEGFKDRDEALLTRESLGPDASFTTLVLRLPGGRYAQMKSWHPRDPRSKTVATSRGLEALDGRDPFAVLAADSRDYQAFRLVWQELEGELLVVAHSAADPKPVTAKLEWEWTTALPPEKRLRLQLRLEPSQSDWRFVVDGPGLDEPAFATVADLRRFLEQQPKGTILTWQVGCKRSGTEPLLSNETDMAAFKAFCASRGILLVIPRGG